MAGFVEFFEGGVQRFAYDRGFRDFVVSGYADSFGWARGASPGRVEEIVHNHQQVMRDGLDRMLRRCQSTGAVRDDVAPGDLLALTMAAVSSIDHAAHKGGPEMYRRVIGIILDGLRPSRDAPTPLPVVAKD